ncbi:agglutination protein [Pseudomonas daroniae]|uniref:Agglutination protein n=1 Tax=Phytopseudomonas daroniae TaxID=2487519 RepID=A0A4Q9QGE8_9GAMM|nr:MULTISPECIES: TolC family outer membrane protein [Pseudomonas]TBU72429.1 agglutination protein [Pseudomonas daroniae]TBU73869.1 agglutination protein [Pseudomonas sp. FRB 228]TBU86405.1 agglutination protein [Pseudomonas daroniae]
MHIESPFAKLALAICIGLAPVAVTAAERQDNLLAVVQETLELNPELQSRLEAFYASTEDRREVFGGYLPSVDLSASAGQANRQFDRRSDYSRNYAEISLTQMLFDGFRVRNRLNRFEHTSRVRYYELLDEAENKTLEASEAYLGVLRHRELVVLAQKNVANHLRTSEHVEQRAGSGVGNRADLQQIEGRLSLARTNLMTEIANLQGVTARFQRLVGQAPGENLESVSLPEGRIPAALENVLRTGYSNNPALYAAFENTQAAESALEETKSSRYPTFELGMRQGIYKNNNSFDNRTDPDSYGSENIIEVRARYNLFRGGSDRAAERAAYRRINQAESLRDKACVDLRQTATIAYTDVLNLNQQRTSLEAHRKASASVVQAYREQFDIGRRSLLDVLDSENEAFQAERAGVNGDFDLQIAKIRTLHSMGQLLQSLSVSSASIPTLEDSLSGDVAVASSRYCATVADAQLNIGRYTQESMAEETIELSGDALFDVGSPMIKVDSRARLQRFVDTLGGTELRAISVVGHTDDTGSDVLNRELSLARATAVRDFLVENGVRAQIISTSGVAADQPIASNATAEGRSANRRVALHVKRAE